MEEAGQKLKRIREKLELTYRDVEEASILIANAHRNDEFIVALSRLADIENKGTLPSIYRLYSLAAVYQRDLDELLSWYGISLSDLAGDAILFAHRHTHDIAFRPREEGQAQVPLTLDPGLDPNKTTYLSRMIQKWGRIPLMLLGRKDLRSYRYGLIGTEDWSMYPIIPAGSLVVIDDSRHRIVESGWRTEFERPIYFLEHRNGYACGWCTVLEDQLIVHPHPASNAAPQVFAYPGGIEVIGQVTQVAMSLESAPRRRPGNP